MGSADPRNLPHGGPDAMTDARPIDRVAVDGFWIDRTPITNRQFKQFIKATGHVTTAEIVPDPKDYPGALPHMLYAGSLTFVPAQHVVDLRGGALNGFSLLHQVVARAHQSGSEHQADDDEKAHDNQCDHS